MSALLLARMQFGMTTVYHFLFVPLTLGLSVLVAIMETLYVKTGNEIYKKMTKFWGKLFVINFVMGVVTGLVQVFQFGMNWSEYARFVGDVFGAPLAIEALLAFFVESTFLGIWIFGWKKLSKKIHLLSIWLVAIAGSLSSLWILIANSFMQNPVGFILTESRVEMAHFGDLLTNPYVWNQFPHVLLGGFTTGAFFVIGISAYHLLRKNNPDFFRKSFKMSIIFGLASVLLAAGVGHKYGQFLIKTQPMKMAAAEALWETADPAPFALLAGINQQKRENTWEISLPGVTSFMAYNKFSGEVKGLNDLQKEQEAMHGPGDYLPPVTTVFWSFRFMVGAGSLMALLALLGALSLRWTGLQNNPFLLRGLALAIPLPFIANSCGWIMAEMGRQPWIVYGLQRVEQAVSPHVSSGAVITTLAGFALLYGLLIIADLYLLVKYAKRGPEEFHQQQKPASTTEEVSLWT